VGLNQTETTRVNGGEVFEGRISQNGSDRTTCTDNENKMKRRKSLHNSSPRDGPSDRFSAKGSWQQKKGILLGFKRGGDKRKGICKSKGQQGNRTVGNGRWHFGWEGWGMVAKRIKGGGAR